MVSRVHIAKAANLHRELLPVHVQQPNLVFLLAGQHVQIHAMHPLLGSFLGAQVAICSQLTVNQQKDV